MKLIIAEKPSLARNIVSALDKCQRKDGYYENTEYIVTWAFGHLFSLCDVEDYTGQQKGTRWSMKNLPCFPSVFKFKLKEDRDGKTDDSVAKQFDTIKYLIERTDVDTIINAGDADREGEIIVRLCIENTDHGSKTVKRLWLPDQTVQTISAALSDMKDDSEYDDLASEGFARTYTDWLYGINLTRYATLRTGTLLRVGRVIAPIVKAIYDRDIEIRNFKPEKYFTIASAEETNGEKVELVSKQKFDKDSLDPAKELCEKYNQAGAFVKSVKSKNNILSPGKLYSLTTLQNHLGKKYKMPMDESLSILQKLYEEGYVTYPRTNSEYLATAEQGKMKTIISNIEKLGYPVEFKFKKTIFDDSKIEAHSALTPTYKIPQKGKLSEREYLVYSAIFRRFVAVFCSEECKVEKTEITVSVGTLEDFVLKGTVIKEKGWTAYDDYSQKDKILPKLYKGDAVNIDFKPAEKETSPPRHYTIETLNNYLKNPFREDKAKDNEEAESDDEDYRAIFEGLELGTEATRTGIIQNAVNSGYISLKKDVYHIEPQGEFFIESLSRMKISMDKYKTSDLGRALKKVYKGEITVNDCVGLAEKEISEIFDKSSKNDIDTGELYQIVGVCPKCGANVIRGRYNYGCVNFGKNCDFSMPCYLCKRPITVTAAAELLQYGKTNVINGFVSKNGKSFSASLILDENKKTVFDFSK